MMYMMRRMLRVRTSRAARPTPKDTERRNDVVSISRAFNLDCCDAMAAALSAPTMALECTEQLNFEQLDPEPPPSDSAPDVAPDPLPPHEVSPPPAEPLPPPPQTPQADDAAALLLMLSSPGADSPVAPFSLPPSQSSKQANSPRGFKEGGQK